MTAGEPYGHAGESENCIEPSRPEAVWIGKRRLTEIIQPDASQRYGLRRYRCICTKSPLLSHVHRPMNTEKQQNSQIKRSTSSASSPSQYGAAIGTSCHPPLPIYPDEEPTSPKIEKNVDGLERYSTEGSERGVEGPRIDVPLTKRKKHILLGLFCLGVFMDGK